MTDKTGGSAFPMLGSVAYNSDWSIDPGMTLRDYFAAKVMQGGWAAQSNEVGYFSPQSTDEQLNNVAELYYRMADAMLRAREK
ncbi:hypothetical protein [Morganella morganii]|uniref:hypothetical protein n=1 Tax=Morganella morganii TaxID=582 RepID=UPI0024BA3760|nr:hypothetical protein [Morganella morganii]